MLFIEAGIGSSHVEKDHAEFLKLDIPVNELDEPILAIDKLFAGEESWSSMDTVASE